MMNNQSLRRDDPGPRKRYDITALVSDADRPSIAALKSRTDSTIDNASTYTEIEFLARAFNATKQARFKDGFLKGVDYLLKAQYANGGWPQFYPFPKDQAYLARIASNRDEKDDFLHITFNDEAMVNVLRLLRRIASDNPEYAFVDADRRARCGKAVAKGIECILKCQVVVNGKRTGWCAQHNERTLAPAGARVYEMPAPAQTPPAKGTTASQPNVAGQEDPAELAAVLTKLDRKLLDQNEQDIRAWLDARIAATGDFGVYSFGYDSVKVQGDTAKVDLNRGALADSAVQFIRAYELQLQKRAGPGPQF